jgi:hypothetical protein
MEYHSEGAARHLSADQFMSVKNLRKIPYVESAPHPVDIGDKQFDLKSDYMYPPEKKDAMIHHIQKSTIDPVHVTHPEQAQMDYGTSATRAGQSPMVLGNGGHRVALASQFKNVHRLPITGFKQKSGYERDNQELDADIARRERRRGRR